MTRTHTLTSSIAAALGLGTMDLDVDWPSGPVQGAHPGLASRHTRVRARVRDSVGR